MVTDRPDSTVPPAALLLGLAGLIPFAALAAAAWVMPEWRDVTTPWMTGYGVVILSFMGGCRWGLAAAGMGQGPSFWPLTTSVLPALYAWAVSALDPAPAQFLLAAGLLTLFVADLVLTRAGGAPQWWPKLRLPLTAGASLSLCVSAAALI